MENLIYMENTIKYILTDIEGTTTSIDFVHKELFPYFVEHIDLLRTTLSQDPKIIKALEAVKATVLEEEGIVLEREFCIDKLVYWCQTDRKHPALKEAQGIVWKLAYEKGEVKGHFYEDVLPALQSWTAQGLKLGIYSSGSVGAQKLIVAYSIFGDISAYFSNYFDTAVGHKREIQSYQNIQQSLNIPAENILFLSDITQELDAAKAAGMQTIQLVRNAPVTDSIHTQVSSFAQIKL